MMSRLIDTLQQRFFKTNGKSVDEKTSQPSVCTHGDLIQDVSPNTQGCEECLALGDKWVHLRMCLICGHVGCCDNSKNKHASQHFHTTGHPLMQSIEPFEHWTWCYIDKVYVKQS